MQSAKGIWLPPLSSRLDLSLSLSFSSDAIEGSVGLSDLIIHQQ